jgi:hypothetical protein
MKGNERKMKGNERQGKGREGNQPKDNSNNNFKMLKRVTMQKMKIHLMVTLISMLMMILKNKMMKNI